MPKTMQEIGIDLHHAASRFARTAQEAEVEGGVPRALDALAELTRQGVAGRAGFRLR